ncbi:Glutamyl/glutaminyl-tRNA synthetase, class Ib [Niveomyces insectorum RCEF 264]|uniref:Glutamyl/glutaminyl-tRNA synthetase, class Ib n=1 Tax=Niveomyces insectorum RCEF 264 TaxID=1081102 RepID=A0A167TE88_9HYPO|nr:Glutamyl/glutaminyl-tRNA synthetase, class Ib [Niveomyces insectorum RCEF 264]
MAALGRTVCFSCRARIFLQSRSSRSYASAAPSAAGPEKARSLLDRRPDHARRARLPDGPARTRFAPSPTGYLHLGSLRTALYNYLLARATNGQFLLRLEDTDQARIVASERLSIYREHADRLLQQGKAFRCFCSHDDLAAHQRSSLASDGTFGTYPGLCLSVSADESAERAARGETFTVRFKSSSRPPHVHDLVYGLHKKNTLEDHFIIMKSDGFPTYHFANVVDDHLMKITHVVRGAEWLISTPKHVGLYDAFGWTPPKFAHVGLLVDSKRQKLSKRNMDIGIDSYRQDGVPPPALLNFAALLGWNPGTISTKGALTLDDLVDNFSLKFTKGDIVVNMEKLAYLRKKHVRLAIDRASSNSRPIDEYLTVPMLQTIREVEAARLSPPSNAGSGDVQRPSASPFALLGDPLVSLREADEEAARNHIRALLGISRSDAVTAAEAVAANRYLIWQLSPQDIRESYAQLGPAARNVYVEEVAQTPAGVMAFLAGQLDSIDDGQWNTANIHTSLGASVKDVTSREEGQPPVSVGYKYLRWALLSLADGPQIGALMEFLGKKETLRRLRMAQSVAEAATESNNDHEAVYPPEQSMSSI